MSRPFDELPTEKLTRAQEDALAKKIQSFKREKDINALVMPNMREAINYAGRIAKERLKEDELTSICYFALYRSARRFQPGKVRFFAFAKAMVRGTVKRNWRTYDVVKNHKPKELTLADYKRVIVDRYTGQVCNRVYDEGEDLSNKEQDDGQKPDSLWYPVHGETQEPEFESMFVQEKWKLVQPIIRSKLTCQEQMILTLAYRCNMSFVFIAELLEVSRSAVQSVHTRALKKIRCELLNRKQLLNKELTE